MTGSTSYPGLSPDIVSATIKVNDLDIHYLQAKPANQDMAPLVLLLHGFPELSYSWRRVITPLANAGYNVIAPDQRGYGRTAPGTTISYEDDLKPYSMRNLVNDIVTLVGTLGYKEVAMVVGHDFGSVVAGFCALSRPDLFKSVVNMSAPFTGVPEKSVPLAKKMEFLSGVLKNLDPPRKYYMTYCSTPDANVDMWSGLDGAKGLSEFLRNFYYAKSADWPGNQDAHPIGPQDLGQLPGYYSMPIDAGMPEAIALTIGKQPAEIKDWLPDDELSVYVENYHRTGFQGGLNWYRALFSTTGPTDDVEGKQVTVPAMFLSGKQDWGVYQTPGAVEAMKGKAFTRMDDVVLIDGAGHWVQQEKHGEVVEHLLRFLAKVHSSHQSLVQ